MANPKREETLVLVKPDGVSRGLIGEIISRFEKRGLKIAALKMVWPDKAHINKHYPESKNWFVTLGSRTNEFFKSHGMDVNDHFGTNDHCKIGKQVKSWMVDYMVQGPVVAMVIRGMCAISTVRKLVGHTYPVEAALGTIRGDFSVDTPIVANVEKRVIKNIIHASGDRSEAAHEIKHWFTAKEIHDYKRADEDVMF